jgi:hypothetical protein
LSDQQTLKKIKSEIKKLKDVLNDPAHENNHIQSKQKLSELQKQHRKLYMKIYSKNYYKNKPEVVIKAVKKYKKTVKGKITRIKYEKSDKKK